MKKPAAITIGSHSDVGLVRTENQDAFGAFPERGGVISVLKGQLFVVADGMGGHRGGREASHLAVQVIRDSYLNSPEGPVGNDLLRAFQRANEIINQESIKNPSLENMGSTCTALVLQDGRACVAHIGDSRAYLITKPSIRQLTNDHSKVGEMQRRGLLTKEEAKAHPDRSQISQALGVKPEAKIDVIEDIPLGNDERFLLCTDGLSNNIDDAELHRIALSLPPEEACKALVNLANSRGGQDNATVQIVHVKRNPSLVERFFGVFQRNDEGR